MKYKSDVSKLNSEITDLESDYLNLKRHLVEKVLLLIYNKNVGFCVLICDIKLFFLDLIIYVIKKFILFCLLGEKNNVNLAVVLFYTLFFYKIYLNDFL